MRSASSVVAVASLLFTISAQAQAQTDVPANYWARQAVTVVVATGVMPAPNGKFNGETKVTRRELAITLARLAKSLERGDWANKPASAVSGGGEAKSNAPVTRYVLASVINKVARAMAAGLPKASGKEYHGSVVLPSPQTVTISKSDPAYDSLAFLGKHRMLQTQSFLLKPGAEPVTGQQVSESLSAMVAGLNDRLTDEPQNQEDIQPPPNRKGHDKH